MVGGRHLDRIFPAVQADADAQGRVDWSMVSVDSTSRRAHQHAAGAPRRTPRAPKRRSTPRQHRPDEGVGRGWPDLQDPSCRGERPTKLITPGQWGDSPQLIPVLERIRVTRLWGGHPRTRPDHLGAIRHAAPAAITATCAGARSSTPSRSRRLSGPTAGAAQPRRPTCGLRQRDAQAPEGGRAHDQPVPVTGCRWPSGARRPSPWACRSPSCQLPAEQGAAVGPSHSAIGKARRAGMPTSHSLPRSVRESSASPTARRVEHA